MKIQWPARKHKDPYRIVRVPVHYGNCDQCHKMVQAMVSVGEVAVEQPFTVTGMSNSTSKLQLIATRIVIKMSNMAAKRFGIDIITDVHCIDALSIT